MEDTQSIRARIRYETERKEPPPGFPRFPDLPGAATPTPGFSNSKDRPPHHEARALVVRRGLGDRPESELLGHVYRNFKAIVEEDMQFGNRIQKDVESYAFGGVPLGCQEARLSHWHQPVDAIVGVENVPRELRVAPVIEPRWITAP